MNLQTNKLLKILTILFFSIFFASILYSINLDPSLVDPLEFASNDMYQNSTYNITASVSCEGTIGDDCSNVEAQLYYQLRDEPRVKSIQSSSASFAGASTDITIDNVNLSSSILFFSYTIDENRPSGFLMRGELTSSTNIHFERVSGLGTITVEWFVVEFEDGVNVQRNTINQGATTNTGITSINTSNSFSLNSFMNNGNAWGNDDFVRGLITSSTNLRTSAGANVANDLDYQIISYPYAQIQSGTASLSGTNLNVDLGNNVNLNKSFILYTQQSSGNTNIGNAGVLSEFVNSSRISFSRNVGSQTMTLDWYIVEFNTNEKVQNGKTSFSTSEDNLIVPIERVNLNKSVVIIPDGKSGSGSFTSDDNPGPGWFTVKFENETAIRLTRAITGTSTAEVSWSVIEFEGDGPAGTRPVSSISNPITTNSLQPQTCSILFGETCEFSWLINASGIVGSVEDLFFFVKSDNPNIDYNISDVTTINIIDDTTAPKYSSIVESPTSPSNYVPNQDYQINISWSDIESSVLNDTTTIDTVLIEHNFTGSILNETMNLINNEYVFNTTDLPAGTYGWRSFANDSKGNLNITPQQIYTIDKATTILTVISDIGFTVPNATQTNVSCYSSNSEVNFTLYRNGSIIGNSIGAIVSDIQTLPLGFTNYTCSNAASQNYSSQIQTEILEVTDKLIPNCNLNFDSSSPITYGTSLNASCSCDNPEVSANLFRNGTNVTSEINTSVDLGAGSYSYSCETIETANYASIANESIFIINQATPVLNLLLNLSASNFVGNTTFSSSISCNIITPTSGNLNISENGTLILNGSTSISTTRSYNTTGTFPITCDYGGNQNYTSLSTQYDIISQDKSSPNVSLNLPTNSYSEIFTNDLIFNVSATDNIELNTCTLWTDINGSWSANETKSFTGKSDSDIWTLLNIPNGNYNWNANCCDNANSTNCAFASTNYSFTIDNSPRIIINSPSGSLTDYTPNLNLTLDRTVDTLWYNINNGDNITICENCNGNISKFVVLEEGNSNIYVYANDSNNNLGFNSTFVSLNMNQYYFDTYLDNSSLSNVNSLQINPGNITTRVAGGGALNVILICATGTCTATSSDVPINNELVSLGHTVTTIIDTDTTWDTSAYDLAVISESVNSGNTGWLKTESIPILTMEGSNWDEYDLGTGGTSDSLTSRDINIVNGTHYITENLGTGTFTIYTGASAGGGDISGWSNDVQNLAFYSGSGTLSALLVVENGGTLVDSTTAAERRAFFAGFDFGSLNANGLTIFERAVDWTAGNEEGSVGGSLTSHAINTTSIVSTFSNISWSEANTDSNNNITVEISANNGINWTTITNGNSIDASSLVNGSSIVYRIIFDTDGTLFPTLLDLEINWSGNNITTEIYENKSVEIIKQISNVGNNVYRINLTIINNLNEPEDVILTDFVPSGFNAGSFNPFWDLSNTTNAPYQGTIYSWNLTVAPLSINQISYAITGVGDYQLLQSYTVAID